MRSSSKAEGRINTLRPFLDRRVFPLISVYNYIILYQNKPYALCTCTYILTSASSLWRFCYTTDLPYNQMYSVHRNFHSMYHRGYLYYLDFQFEIRLTPMIIHEIFLINPNRPFTSRSSIQPLFTGSSS